jgi:hypothetical protein
MNSLIDWVWLIPRLLYWIISVPLRLYGVDMPHIGPE